MMGLNMDKYVYSPDMKTFNLDGNHSIILIVLSLLISPIRLVIRVVHNIVILPLDLKKSFYKELLIISSILCFIGLADFIFYKHWVILFSQVLLVILSYMKINTIKEHKLEHVKAQEVVINTKAVKTLCEDIYDEIEDNLKTFKPISISVDEVVNDVCNTTTKDNGISNTLSGIDITSAESIRQRVEKRVRNPRSIFDRN